MKTNKEIITEIIEDLDLKFNTRKGAKINKETLIDCWSIYRKGSEHKIYGYTANNSMSKQYLNIFASIKNKPSKESWKAFILRNYGYKYCSGCTSLLLLSAFHKDITKNSNIHAKCKDCESKRYKIYVTKNKDKYAYYAAKRRAAKLSRTPVWLTEEDTWLIKEFYLLAEEREKYIGIKWHVDHIIPLQGKLVSGLHIPQNLQVISAKENISKSNKFTVG